MVFSCTVVRSAERTYGFEQLMACTSTINTEVVFSAERTYGFEQLMACT